MPTTTTCTSFTLDYGELTLVLDEIVLEGLLIGKVDVQEHESLIGSGYVISYTVGTLPVSAWSTGERLMWSLLVSVAGCGTCNLRDVRDWFSGTPDQPVIETLLSALWSR